MLQHPLLVYKKIVQSFAYQSLLRTYVLPGIPYLLDSPFPQGKVRLTNIETGEYIIYGNYGSLFTENDKGIDELLYIHLPLGMLRVKIDTNVFITTYIDINIHYLAVISSGYALTAIISSDGLSCTYRLDRVDISEINSMRAKQYRAITDTMIIAPA